MRAVVQQQRQRAGALTCVENGHSSGERNFGGISAEGFPVNQDRAEHIAIGDAEFQVRAIQDIGQRRRFGGFPGPVGEREQAVVFVEGKRDVSGRWLRGLQHALRESGRCKNACENNEEYPEFHLPPAFLFC